MIVRPANVADIPAMMKLERDAASAAHWSRELYERVFRRSTGARRAGFVVEGRNASTAREFRFAHSRSARHDSGAGGLVVIGFLVAHGIEGEWEIENLVVAENERRKGLGKLLFDGFLDAARAENAASVFLEVRESNHGARGLYEKLGFVESGRRKLYYRDPEEDAVLYRMELSRVH